MMRVKPSAAQLSRAPVRAGPPRWQALLASVGLSLLFLLIYGSSNWIAAHRANLPSLYFEWERGLPFVPLLIPAYLSLDLFFVGAPFLCRTRDELRVYSLRIAAAIVVAGISFVLFPLRFAFARPETTGALGAMFDWFRSMDAPHNLVPSLHAALLLLVGQVYLGRLRGLTRWAVLIWFVLIGLSPILTYQHHVIDIVAGFILAAYCFYLLPAHRVRSSSIPNRRLALYHAAGAAGCLIAAVVVGKWAALAVWPAIALGLVAFAYLGAGPAIFRKTTGRISLSARFVLGPYLIGQVVSVWYYRRQCDPWGAVTGRVWVGRRLSNRLAAQAAAAGVSAVLDLTSEFSAPAAFRRLAYRNIPILDLTAPAQAQLHDMARFIAEQEQHGIVYVHCKIGYSRSAAAIGAWLLWTRNVKNVAEAIDRMRPSRPRMIIRPEIIAALERFQAEVNERPVSRKPFLLAPNQPILA